MILFPIKKLSKNQGKWALAILTIIFSIFLFISGVLDKLINLSGQFGIIGVLISGMLFVYFFTAAPATASLISFTDYFNPLIVSFIGAIGAMIGSLIIFNYFKKDTPDEIKKIVKKTKLDKLKKKKFKWIIPLIVAFIIASPIPDEAAIYLLSSNNFNANTFMIFAFISAFIGLLILTTIVWLI